jgi:hypothetical protein
MLHSIVLILLTYLVACSDLDRIRQIRTVADMQTIIAKIEQIRANDPEFPTDSAKVRKVISSIAGGRDAWRHEFLYLARPTSRGVSYVLVSLGSDGKLDVAQLTAYFNTPEQVIHDMPWKDIVFRDGHPITRAGK